ncbi:chromate efflux transporter [Alicyclobacillus sp.]|uniref:chromate efflux transporter n=1 Tax=Alicyclobacillus sp. TaxID=61169 RepID=UPI0025C293A2|nr:chromate efflux transporter [Alicyclobacillus sp.]MCL6517631.1 chromate efflux transporter [Alicyclobacillus sp.]
MTPPTPPATESAGTSGVACAGSAGEVFGVALRLGLTSFGGPIAHLGYFRNEYVERRRWLDDASYADLVALCQFLPGPASSQVGIAIGLLRAGLPGALAAWLGFTLPSAIALALFAEALQRWHIHQAGWLHGLMIVAVAVVAQAVWGMARSFAAGRTRAAVAALAAVVSLLWPTPWTQVAVIVGSGLIGWFALRTGASSAGAAPLPIRLSRRFAIGMWALFFLLLIGLPVLRTAWPAQTLALFDTFYRAGSLVFGGGHVVLPLLQSAVVPPGWVTNDAFLAGYGAAQAVPGPLFTFSAYLGAVMGPAPNHALGAAIALAGMFLPAFLLVFGALPFWAALRTRPGFQSALAGIQAGVVGILLAALYNPVWTSAVHTPVDFALALVAFVLLTVWKIPPWGVVVLCAAAGWVLFPA